VPIETYVRVGQILLQVEGEGDARAYFRRRGLLAGERLHRVGLYRQFNTSVETWGKRAGTIATTMSGVLYNFTRWTFATKEGRHPFEITVEDATHFPEALRFVGEGFIEYVSRHMSEGRDVHVSSERVTPDRVVYTVSVAEVRRATRGVSGVEAPDHLRRVTRSARSKRGYRIAPASACGGRRRTCTAAGLTHGTGGPRPGRGRA
jgi:hypothetical protein